MGLDDLLATDDEHSGRRSTIRDRAQDRRRNAGLAVTAVAVAVGLGVGIGLLAATLGDGGSDRTITSFGSTPAPSATAPRTSPPVVPTSASPSPSPSLDVPGSGTDVGYVVTTRETSQDGAALQLSFDRVQFLTGDAAEREARKRGEQADSDYYVVNDNTRLRTLLVTAGATVTGDSSFNSWAGDEGGGQRSRTLEELARFVSSPQGRETLFDLRYDAQGRVTAVAERYLP